MDCPVNPIMNWDSQNVALNDEQGEEEADRQYCY